MIYLNTLDQCDGGATYFRDLNVAVQPQAGRAVCWTNTNPDGSVVFEMDDADRFYRAHREYFETGHKGIDHPTPIQGDWKVDAVNLPREIEVTFQFSGIALGFEYGE